jgi:hypothetical protein
MIKKDNVMEKNIKNMLLALCLCVGYTSQMLSSFEVKLMEDRAKEAREAKESAEKKQQEKEQEWQEMQIRHREKLMQAEELRRQIQEIQKEKKLSDEKLVLNNLQRYMYKEDAPTDQVELERFMKREPTPTETQVAEFKSELSKYHKDKLNQIYKKAPELRNDLELLESQKNLEASTLEKSVSDERNAANLRLKEARSETRKAKFKYYQEVVKAKIPQSIKDFFAKLQDHVASVGKSIKLTTSGLSMKLLPNRKKNEGSIEG